MNQIFLRSLDTSTLLSYTVPIQQIHCTRHVSRQILCPWLLSACTVLGDYLSAVPTWTHRGDGINCGSNCWFSSSRHHLSHYGRFVPEHFQRYKIQQLQNQPTFQQTERCIVHSLYSYGLVVSGMFAFHWFNNWQAAVYDLDPALPALETIIVDIVYAAVVREIIFYYAHRLLHHSRFF